MPESVKEDLATKVARLIFLTFVWVISVLPAGDLLGINVKILLYILVVTALAMQVLSSRSKLKELIKLVPYFLVSVTFLLVWFMIGLIQVTTETRFAVNAFKDIFVTVSLVYITYFMIKTETISVRNFLLTIVGGAAFYSAIKVILAGLLLTGKLSIYQLVQIFKAIGYEVIYGDIADGLSRIEFTNDSLIPFLLLFVTSDTCFGLRFKSYQKVLLVILFGISIFLSFSRFKWAIAILCLVLGLLLNLFTSNRRSRAVQIGSVLLAIMVLAGAAAGWQGFGQAINTRLSGAGSVISDDIRSGQVRPLVIEFNRYLIFGKGLGSYIPSLIRSNDEATPYFYEIQWLALAMQFGIVGLAVILVHIGLIGWHLIKQTSLTSITMLTSYFAWLVSGFFNPALISSVGGLVFSIFLVYALSPRVNGKISTES